MFKSIKIIRENLGKFEEEKHPRDQYGRGKDAIELPIENRKKNPFHFHWRLDDIIFESIEDEEDEEEITIINAKKFDPNKHPRNPDGTFTDGTYKGKNTVQELEARKNELEKLIKKATPKTPIKKLHDELGHIGELIREQRKSAGKEASRHKSVKLVKEDVQTGTFDEEKKNDLDPYFDSGFGFNIKLNKEEQDYIQAYVLSSDVNDFLRTNQSMEGKVQQFADEVMDPNEFSFKKQVEALDKITQSASTPEETKVYRSIPTNVIAGKKAFLDLGFSSTSADINIPVWYQEQAADGLLDTTILEITLRKGSKAVSLHGLVDFGFDHQKEILIARNSRFILKGEKTVETEKGPARVVEAILSQKGSQYAS